MLSDQRVPNSEGRLNLYAVGTKQGLHSPQLWGVHLIYPPEGNIWVILVVESM